MPNLIHSLDAASLMLLRDKFDKLHPDTNNFYTIHDCYAVTANNVSSLILLLKYVYTMLYSDEHYLRKLDDYILSIIKNIERHNTTKKKIKFFEETRTRWQKVNVIWHRLGVRKKP